MVVHPDRATRATIRDQLGASHRIVEVATGADALEQVHPARVDCALVGDRCNDLDMLVLLSSLRRSGVGVVVIAEHAEERDLLDYMRAGAQDCLRYEGLTERALASAIRRSVAEAERGRTAAAHARLWERMPLGVMVLAPSHDTSLRVVHENPAAHALRRLATPGEGPIPGIAELTLREVAGRTMLTGEQGLLGTFEIRDGAEVRLYDGRVSRIDARSVLVLLEDVTELSVVRRQLEAAGRMEAIGRLAGGVAHDFNNMLTVISGHASFIRDATQPGDPARDDVDSIIDAAGRSAELTRQLLAFSRRQIRAPRVLEMNATIESLEPLLRRVIGEDVELLTQLDPHAGSIEADPTQVEQILMNLVINARDSMPGGGTLRVETSQRAIVEPRRIDGDVISSGVYSELTVIDEGTGMDAETRSKMFEPFFTTKSNDEGTGLGLATVHGIVSQSGGYVWADSEVGVGTTFHVLFPRIDRRPTAMPPPSERVTLPGGETILFVEDERLVRRAIGRILTNAGYRVIEADLPSKALEAARAHQASVDLVLTDIVMPEMSGREMIRGLVQELPGARVLFMSGYTNDAESGAATAVLSPDTPFIGKPFTRQALLEALHGALSRGPTLSELERQSA